jgi:fructoselysine-6-P-deglycase FrlB-like protein
MDVKLFEIRDRATFIPVIAFKKSDNSTSPTEKLLESKMGLGSEVVVIQPRSNGVRFTPYVAGDKTMTVAHHYINQHFDELLSGAVIDVQLITEEDIS